MTTIQAKQIIGIVKKMLGGNAESYYRAKYVTYYGRTIFEITSQNGREWYISKNLLSPEQWEHVQKQGFYIGIFREVQS